ncbi:YdeI/OmpD-associated family protein [Parasphingorhabdus halotolerans]|uniref:YdhG-like domain-containing protein n=1 Tax=Parasphingorhabdus halotolerans TaxID=2725558 RepID=A0A6H2DME2_9SPHN|nr:YdeI/OmpD-associated family protein [Parasphingorhabdus halotolerans]QJB69842.1 hypothetical protein HF685_11600 [Parasphingorhabdus halotolerans]
MGSANPLIDAYVEKAQDFAKPILIHLRALIHEARPDIEEAVKWGMPFFTLNGKNLCNIAAFKGHAVFGFWEGLNVEIPKSKDAMGHLGRIRSLDDLPSDKEMLAMIRSVIKQMEHPEKAKAKPIKRPVKVPPMPDDFAAAIAAKSKAQETYDGFAPSHKRDYLEWVIDAKRDETRQKRIKQAVEWMAEGKDRNWKYR